MLTVIGGTRPKDPNRQCRYITFTNSVDQCKHHLYTWIPRMSPFWIQRTKTYGLNPQPSINGWPLMIRGISDYDIRSVLDPGIAGSSPMLATD